MTDYKLPMLNGEPDWPKTVLAIWNVAKCTFGTMTIIETIYSHGKAVGRNEGLEEAADKIDIYAVETGRYFAKAIRSMKEDI